MIIGFYSYKGGVGRSLVLANVAVWLAAQGRRIGMLDLDVESPGLHTILQVKPNPEGDLLALMLGGNIPFLERLVVDVGACRQEYFADHSLRLKGLFLLPTVPDVEHLSRIQWDDQKRETLREIAGYFIRSHRLDHLLVDARTGLSQAAYCTASIAERVVLLFRLNGQNLSGVTKLVAYFRASGKDCVLVASGIPDAPQRKDWVDAFETRLDRPLDLILPYDPDLAFGEMLYVVEKPDSLITQVSREVGMRAEA